MIWSDDDVTDMHERAQALEPHSEHSRIQGGTPFVSEGDYIRTIASRALELAAARRVNLTGQQLLYLCDVVRQHEAPSAGDLLFGAFAALGARNATLEAEAKEERERAETLHRTWQRTEKECTSIRAELARLKPSGQVAEDEQAVRDVLVGNAHNSTHDALSRLAAGAQEAEALRLKVVALEAEISRLNVLINTPQTQEFVEAMRFEAAHQQERWGAEHDAGKADADWFWLLGYLAGKATRPDATHEKKLHHIIATAAACMNWHRHLLGAGTMRPGIEPPKGVS